ncbi:hypothetical protein CcCBS67573_g00954 [Chytriomyces confervae]|uniref:Uncharacterized protein n=1 Tax=Chytriomyces confervae TaxID=246404 RepID=A0A507FN34_9FUNG|nr:hypothetical protein HDU80_005013 [Chytriomyces hyalinus]TPX77819.1 hypothetical protein CcCBS67573_g00954 [Chytriomyces confervae]
MFVFKNLPATLRSGSSLPTSPAPWVDLVIASDGVEAVADVVFELVGYAKVSLFVTPDSLFASPADRMAGQMRRIDSEEVFVTVSQKLADPQKFAKGAHTYTLNMDIPNSLFPSFTYATQDKSEFYSIRYVLRVRLPTRTPGEFPVAEHPVIMTTSKITEESMTPMSLVDFMGSQYGSVLTLKARRSQFLPLQPMFMLYTHHAPVQLPVTGSYLELVQRAGLPGPNGKQDRMGIERIISTFEIPSIPAGMTSTYTLRLPSLPQLPPTIQLGPIDISYLLRVVSTFSNGGHEILGPIEISILPEVQKLDLPSGYDEAVELLEGNSGTGTGFRPRIYELVQWIPPEQRRPVAQTSLPFQNGSMHSLGSNMVPGPATTGTSVAGLEMGMEMGMRFGTNPAPVRGQSIHTGDDMMRRANMEREAQQQAMRIAEAHAELERVKLETSRERELALERKRQEETRIRNAAQAEMDRQLKIEREKTLALRLQVERMKSGVPFAKVSSTPSASIPAYASYAGSSVPTYSNTGLSLHAPTAGGGATSLPNIQTASIPAPPPSSMFDRIVESPISPPSQLQQPQASLARQSPALETHAYPTPVPLTLARPSSPPSQFNDTFSRTTPSQSRTNSAPQSYQEAQSEAEQLVDSIFEQAVSDYKSAVKRNYKALMGAKDRDIHKARIANEVSGLVGGILGDVARTRIALDRLNAKYATVDKEVIMDFERDKRESVLRQVKALYPSLQAAIAAGVVKDDLEVHEQCALALKPLRQDLTDSVFYVGMRDTERRDLEILANRIWTAAMRCFETDVRDPLIKELLGSNGSKDTKTMYGMGSSSGTMTGNRASSKVPGMSLATNGQSASVSATPQFGGSTGNVTPQLGSGGALNQGSSSSSTSSLPGASAANSPPVASKSKFWRFSKSPTTPGAVCMRDDCGVKKTGHGSTKMFCSQKCENLVMKQQRNSFQ